MQVYRPSRRQPAGIQLGQLPACSWENEKGEENVSGRNVTGSKENDSEAFNTNIRTYAQVQVDTERRTYRYQRLISTILEVKSQLSSLILIVIVMKITHSLDQNQSTDGLCSHVSVWVFPVRWKLRSERSCCRADLELMGIRSSELLSWDVRWSVDHHV